MSNRYNQFYLTLPSNSSMKYFPSNTVACYITQLARRIQLEGDDWEVALVEVHYPYSFVTGEENANIEFDYKTSFSAGHRNIPVPSSGKRYKDIEELLDEINKDANLQNYIDFTYDSKVNRVKVNITDVTKLKLSRTLALQLGIEAETSGLQERGETEITGLWPPNLTAVLKPYMYVYCDLVEPQMIGDTSAPLLKIVNMDVANYVYGSYNTVAYSNPHYVPIMKGTFETVEINLRDDTGASIPFVFGTSCVTLHFRRAHQ